MHSKKENSADDMKQYSKRKQALIDAAKKQYKTIIFLSRFDGFTWEDGVLLFWFNTPDQSTHMVREDEI
jgi:hypothetical protein